MKLIESLKKRDWPWWLPGLAALLGAVLYLVQAFIYAHTTVPGLDEGSYLYKGYLYLRGIYEPFQPYGPLTNKAPFAFLIPGSVQFIFGPGLRTGRYFAVVLGLLTVLGTWVVARRWAGKWIAAASVWMFALGPMMIKNHAVTASEVIIACLLAWVCVFTLAEQRPLWQIVMGSVLAVLIVLTRQNMVPVLPLLVLYVFWQHGRQKGLWSLAVISLVFLAVHLYYWPNILIIWAPWLPEDLTPFLDRFRLPEDATAVWDPSIGLANRLIAFFQGLRYHFIAAVGGIFTLLFWPRGQEWKSDSARRAAIFLAVSYFVLFAMHAWATLASQYESYSCVYCFTAYLTFFDPLGILLVAITFHSWHAGRPSAWLNVLFVILIPVLSLGMGVSLFESVGNEILRLPVPRIRDGWFLPGTTQLVDLLRNKFAFSLPVIKRYIGGSLGLFIGTGIGLVAWIVWHRLMRPKKRPPYVLVLANTFLITGLALFPVLNSRGAMVDCMQNLITSNEELGYHLRTVMPANSLIYWDGGLSFTPMLYVPDGRIFPPQINDGYTYRLGGDPDTLYRFSHWNAELDHQWRESADVFIIESKRYFLWTDFLNPQDFEEYQRPPTVPSCEEGSALRIFHRLP
jgi:hypothetical protein